MKNNLRSLLIVAGLAGITPAFSQKDNVGIGTSIPDHSALLDLSSNNKGFLMPRMTLAQRNFISSPANGLIIYQTDSNSGFYFYNGKSWNPMNEAKSILADPNDWSFGGNAPVAGSFVGTTNNVPLMFKSNNVTSGYLDFDAARSNAYYGFNAGVASIASSGAFNTAVGYQAALSGTTASYNTAIGARSLLSATSGGFNTGLGAQTLEGNTTGNFNMAIGLNALRLNTTGSFNVAIGRQSLYNSNGSGNVAIGNNAGFSLATGSNNIFIGYEAGFNETGNNKLYIANSNTIQPTIYGDFSANFISIGNNITLAKRDAIATSGAYGLLVEKGILTEKLKVATIASADWADYVFDKNYKMLTLEEVEKFINENKHLPNVPSAEEMSKNGLDVVTSDSKLLEKIEELTLYMIEMNKEIKALKAENQILKKK